MVVSDAVSVSLLTNAPYKLYLVKIECLDNK